MNTLFRAPATRARAPGDGVARQEGVAAHLPAGLQRFAVAALPASPWKNGGGSTRVAASWPPGAGLDDFDWRVSIATIDASGPFSPFPGVDRCIMLLSGDGVRLEAPSAGIEHRLDRPLAPFGFAGEHAVQATLLGAVSTDLNIMTRRATHQARVAVASRPCRLEAAPQGLLLAARGAWRAGDQTLAPGEGLWWAGPILDWQLHTDADDARLVWVQWQQRR